MKQVLLILCLVAVASLLMAGKDSLPRVYVQKLVLEDGSNPVITVEKDLSAPEYFFEAFVKERPEEIINTDTKNVNHLSINRVGDGEAFPYAIVCKVNLGNFPTNWASGETLHLKLVHKESKQIKEWDLVIPEGSTLIKMLDEPLTIPPFAAEKTGKHGCASCPEQK